MATFPTTQDVTQYLGSSVGKPVDFNPNQQSPSPMMQQPHPQQAQTAQPSPYMPSGGPYNPYMSKWASLMNGPNSSGGAMPTQQPPQMPTGGHMVAGLTMPGGMPAQQPPMPAAGGSPYASMMPGRAPISMGGVAPPGQPGMMQGMFSHMPMVR